MKSLHEQTHDRCSTSDRLRCHPNHLAATIVKDIKPALVHLGALAVIASTVTKVSCTWHVPDQKWSMNLPVQGQTVVDNMPQA